MLHHASHGTVKPIALIGNAQAEDTSGVAFQLIACDIHDNDELSVAVQYGDWSESGCSRRVS